MASCLIVGAAALATTPRELCVAQRADVLGAFDMVEHEADALASRANNDGTDTMTTTGLRHTQRTVFYRLTVCESL